VNRILQYHAVLVLHNKIPVEIWSKIFLLCQLDSFPGPQNWITGTPPPSNLWLNFSQVCSKWRRITHNTPGLWNRIHVPHKSPYKGECITDIAHEVLSRSKSPPVHFVSTGPILETEEIYFFSLLFLELITPPGAEPDRSTLSCPAAGILHHCPSTYLLQIYSASWRITKYSVQMDKTMGITLISSTL
jgi:hypothetical protein